MRKQFDLQDWLKDKSQRVETRDGRPVRIVCWDRNGDYPIMALATEANGNESYITCLSNGRKTIHSQEFPSDLFIVTPEEELTVWEKAVGRAIAGFQFVPRDKDGMKNIHDVDAYIKKNAAELLAIARKQLHPEIEIAFENDVQFGKAEMKEALGAEYEKGRRDVMRQFGFDSNGYDPVYVLKQIKSKWPMSWEKMVWQDIETSGKVHCKSYDKGYDDGKKEALKDLPRWERLYSKENADKIPDCIIPGKALDNRLVHRGFELKITDLEKLPGFKED